jgi:alkanesulfonate monooxygenase SsuD/methylene tetrahydromethanopterin reductase-like flavin-dependent oxidoreductase (luciferase family)
MIMVKVILQMYPVLPAENEAERERLRPLGRNADLYNETLHGMDDIVKAADELGLWGVATIEHHFWSEGYEVGPNPGILNAHWASITKNINVGALGYVMTTQDPLKVAEETAIIDHLSRGRYFVGVARGYQSRWTNIIGQKLGAKATLSDGSADDENNRRIFEEGVDLLQKAWTQESVRHNGKNWQVPNPYEEGVEWLMSPVTEKMGAPGEIVNGKVHSVSVVPSTYQKPHPQVFMASSASRETIEYGARKGFVPTHFSRLEKAAANGKVYTEVAQASGHSVGYGEKQALVRWMEIGDTMEDARQRMVKYDLDIFKALTLLLPKGTTQRDNLEDFYHNGTDEEWIDFTLKTGLYCIGTLEDVKQQFIEQWREFPAEYCMIVCHYAQQPKELVIEYLEKFMKHIKPELDKITAEAYENNKITN